MEGFSGLGPGFQGRDPQRHRARLMGCGETGDPPPHFHAHPERIAPISRLCRGAQRG